MGGVDLENLYRATLKPGFHMIAAIAEKKKVWRSQRSYENHFSAIVVAAIATIAGKWFPYDRYDRCNR